MMDERLYRETFSRLRASGEAKKEVLVKMNEMNKKTMRRPLKALRAVAMAAVLTLALAVSANAATNGELFENMRIIFQDDSRIVLENDAGARVEVTGVFADAQLEDGKLILTVDNAEFDITDEIAENGVYTGTVKTAGGEDVGVTVTGTLEDCEVQLSSQDGDTDYNVATESSASAETYTSVITTTIEDSAKNRRRDFPPAVPFYFLKLSFRLTLRLNTRWPGALSLLSRQK